MAIPKLPAIVGLVLFLGCTVLASVAEAAVAHVTCGQVITTNTTLDSDVGPCEGDGIVIGADNIGLNLNGYSVLGSSSSLRGIVVSALGSNHSGVTVRNGTVSGFETGVLMAGGTGNSARNLVISGNRCFGISVAFAAIDNTIRANRIGNNGCGGVAISGSAGTLVHANRITQNSGPGVGIFRGSLNFATGRNTVSGNTIVGNTRDGIDLGSFAGSQTVVGNTILRNAQNGIYIGTYSTDNLVQSNIIRANALNGVVIAREPTFQHNNQILDNIATRNRSFDLADLNDDCGGGTWAGNQFTTRNQPCIN